MEKFARGDKCKQKIIRTEVVATTHVWSNHKTTLTPGLRNSKMQNSQYNRWKSINTQKHKTINTRFQIQSRYCPPPPTHVPKHIDTRDAWRVSLNKIASQSGIYMAFWSHYSHLLVPQMDENLKRLVGSTCRVSHLFQQNL